MRNLKNLRGEVIHLLQNSYFDLKLRVSINKQFKLSLYLKVSVYDDSEWPALRFDPEINDWVFYSLRRGKLNL